MSLISLPRIHKQAFGHIRSVPPALRARAAAEIRLALQAGKLTEADVAAACRAGDAGIARLMLGNHALTGEITGTLDASAAGSSITPATASHIILWARSLVAAGRLSDAQIAELPPHCDIRQLLPLLITSTLDASCCQSSRHVNENCLPVLDVSHSYLDALISPHDLEAMGAPTITITQINSPFFDLPESLSPEDCTAVLSALSAICSADPFGLISGPQDTIHACNGWIAEILEDGLIRSSREPDGTWRLSPDLLETLHEEIGIDISEPESVAEIGSHIEYLHQTRHLSKTIWPPNSTAMRSWRNRNADTPVGQAVTHLLAIHRDLKSIRVDRSVIDIEYEGDSVGVMVCPPSLHQLSYFDTNSYGMNESPQMTLNLLESQQNPSSFWQLHQSAVMVANLITEAGHVIQSIPAQATQSEASEPRLAA